MIVLRSKFFDDSSKDKKKKRRKEQLKGAGMIAGGTSAAALPLSVPRLGKKIDKYYQSYVDSSANSKETNEKLIKAAKNKGVEFIDGDVPYMARLSDGSTVVSTGKFGKTKAGAGMLSHELGHVAQDRGKSGKLDNLAYKLNKYDAKFYDGRGKYYTSFLNGIHSGYVKEKNKEEGKETSKFTKYKTAAVPLLLNSPELVMEGGATRTGWKYLKKAGADKSTLRAAKRANRLGFGTYAAAAAANVGLGYGGELAGKGLRKLTTSKNKSEKRDVIKKKS